MDLATAAGERERWATLGPHERSGDDGGAAAGRGQEDDAIAQLEYVRDLLNEGAAPWIPKLRGWLERWWGATSLNAMLEENPAIQKAIDREYAPLYTPSFARHAFQELRPPRNVAVWLFIQITLNDECWRLGGCPRCGKVFVRQSARASIYCSRRCASAASAVLTYQKQRAERDRRKLEAAQVAIERWECLSQKNRAPKQGWKEFVAGYNKAAELTAKYLTRAVNSGRLKPPKGERP